MANTFVENVNIVAGYLVDSGIANEVLSTMHISFVSALPISGDIGDIVYLTTTSTTYAWNGAEWLAIGSGSAVSIVSSIPTTGNDGDIVFNTTDSSMYVRTSGAWNIVSASLAQLPDYNSTVAIVGSLPLTGNTLGDLVYLSYDNSLNIWNGTFWEKISGQSDWNTWSIIPNTTTYPYTQGGFVTVAGIPPVITVAANPNNNADHIAYINLHAGYQLSNETYLATKLYAMYQKFFSRQPDLAGLKYWMEVAINGGWNEYTLATSIYSAGVSYMMNNPVVDSGWHLYGLIPNTNVAISSDGGAVSSAGVPPVVTVADSGYNVQSQLDYINAHSTAAFSNGNYIIDSIIAMYTQFFGRSPELAGAYYWMKVAIDNGWDEDTLARTIYSAGLALMSLANGSPTTESDWHTWNTIPNTASAVSAHGGAVTSTGTPPVAAYGANVNNDQSYINYITANQGYQLINGNYLVPTIIEMYQTFFGRNPEVAGMFYWMNVAIGNTWSEFNLATAIYTAVMSTTALGTYQPSGVFVDTIPSNPTTGDVVINILNGNTQTWDGATWVVDSFTPTASSIPAVGIVTALSATGVEGEITYNTTDGKMYVYLNGAWTAYFETITSTASSVNTMTIVTTNPLTVVEGQVIYNSTTKKMYQGISGVWTAVVEPTTAAATVADGSLTTAAFAAGIAPVEIMTPLPTTGNYVGRMVYNTSDGQLYRYTATGFTNAVPTTALVGTITSPQIATAAITATHVGANSISTASIQADAITANHIATGAVTADSIAANSISAGMMQANSISAGAIQANAITAGKIAAGAITAGTISAGAISATEIAAGAITTSKIYAGAIIGSTIAAGAIDATKIVAGSISAGLIAADAINAGHIQAGAITASEISTGAITALKMAANSVTAACIQAGSISATEIAANAITSSKILAGSITAGHIAAGTITATQIGTGAVGAAQLAASSVTASAILAGTITGVQIQDGSITASEISANAIIGKVIQMDSTQAASTYTTTDSIFGTQTTAFSFLNTNKTYGVCSVKTNSGGGSAIYGLCSNPAQTGAAIVGVQQSSSTSSWGGYFVSSSGTGVLSSGSTYDFYAQGAGANYGPFTGAHDTLVDKNYSCTVGDIAVIESVPFRTSVSNVVVKSKLSTVAKELSVYGVYAVNVASECPALLSGVPKNTPLTDYSYAIVNAIGEGQINVCGEGGNINVGDYICTSNTKGKGMKQDDSMLHNYTVAKALESVDWSKETTTTKMIACTYHCG